MHIIVIVVNDIIVILKHISKLGTRKRLLNTKIEPNFTDSKKSNVDGGTCLDLFALNGGTVSDYCFTLRSRSLYFVFTKLSFALLRATSS